MTVRRLGGPTRRLVVAAFAAALTVAFLAAPAGAGVNVADETALRAAWSDGSVTDITLTADITLTCGGGGALVRAATGPVTLHGAGHTVTQTCADAEMLTQTDTGAITVDEVTLTGGSIAVHGAGPITVTNSVITGLVTTNTAIGIEADGGALVVSDTEITDLSGTQGAIGVFGLGAVDVARTRVARVASPGTIGTGIEQRGGAPVSVVDSSIADVSSGGNTYGLTASRAPLVLRGSSVVGVHGSAGAVGVMAGSLDATDDTVRDVGGPTAAGIVVFADATVARSTIADVVGDGPSVSGVSLRGATTLVDSTITRVTGSAIASYANVSVVFSTITETGAAAGAAAVGDDRGGAGILSLPLDRSKQVFAGGGRLRLYATVIARPNAGAVDCGTAGVAVVESLGYDRADDTTCGLTAVGDLQQVGFDPLLGALADNGGPTPTRLPAAASPLVDAIPLDACASGPAVTVAVDQRGLPRAAIGGCDVGAVELQPEVEPTFTG